MKITRIKLMMATALSLGALSQAGADTTSPHHFSPQYAAVSMVASHIRTDSMARNVASEKVRRLAEYKLSMHQRGLLHLSSAELAEALLRVSSLEGER